MLKDQISALHGRYKAVQKDKNRHDHTNSQQLCQGTKEIDALIGQLDTWRDSNLKMEAEQIHLFEELDRLTEVSAQASQDLVDTQSCLRRGQGDCQSVQGELHHCEQSIRQEKNTQLTQMERLDHLRARLMERDGDNIRIQRQTQAIGEDIQQKEHTSQTLEDVCRARDDDCARFGDANRQAQQEIQNVKFELKQVDDEICYFEEQNRKNSAA